MFTRLIGVLGMLTLFGVAPLATADDQTTTADIKEETLDAATALKNYAVEKKREAVTEVEQLVAELDLRIYRLQAQADQATDAAKAKMQATLETLKRKRDALQARIDALADSTADAWGHTKQGFIEAFDELQSAYEQAKTDFKS